LAALNLTVPFYVANAGLERGSGTEVYDREYVDEPPSVFRSGESFGEGGMLFDQQPDYTFAFANAGDAVDAKPDLLRGNPYSDPSDADGAECISVWRNTFSKGKGGNYAVGRELVGCEQKKDCKKSDEVCMVNKKKGACECSPRYPPPPEEYPCCCCVDRVYIKENNPRLPIPIGDGKLERLGQRFTVKAKLKHKGHPGKKCKCTMTWSEYANRDYDYKGKSGALLGERWNSLPDGKWSENYESEDDVGCYDRTIECATDSPGTGVHAKKPHTWEIWIEVCVYSCDKADCHCDNKKKCARLHQVVRQPGSGGGTADMEVNDGDVFKDDIVDPPTESPGGWIAEVKEKKKR
jgi:hypothetical protein